MRDETRKSYGGRRCPSCGEREDEFLKSGRLGCERCYDVFYDIIAPRTGLDRGVRHVGGHPGERAEARGEKYRSLKRELVAAAEREDFSAMARIRSELTRLREEEGE